MAKREFLTAPRLSSRMPSGIPYIVGNETAERFSFYGMKAILVIFMTKYLMDSDGNRAVMSETQAKMYNHLFIASAYFFPIIGAILADWLLGKYRTIVSLSIVYCLGHLALALDETRVGLTLGLTLIAVGAGGIKPCVSAHVGDQFGSQNEHLISKIFSWFYFAINLGAFASTLLTPWLLNHYGPRIGPRVAFGVPGALMLLATIVFWCGRNKFVHIPAGGRQFFTETFDREGRQAIWNLARLYVFVAVFWMLFDQTSSAWVLQAENMDRRWLGVEWFSSQIGAVNPILILAFIPLFSYWIYPAINKVYRLTPLRKVAIGFFLAVPAFALPAWIESEISGGRIVRFKAEKDAEKVDQADFQSTTETDSRNWPAKNLIDGKTDGRGWVSQKADNGKKSKLFPQEIVIRLRERRAWKISQVKLYPKTNLSEFLESQKKRENDDSKTTAADVRACWAKDVEILISKTRIGPWKRIAKTELSRTPAAKSLDFDPVDAEYVMVRVLSNHGGDYVSLSEIEVNSSASRPSDAHAHAEGVWPNVAATGHRPSIVWQLLGYAIMTAAEILVSITCLEFSYTQAPKKMKSLIMAFYLLSVSAGNLFTFFVNSVIEREDGSSRLPGADYYWFFTAIMFATATLFLLTVKSYRGRTYIQSGDESTDDEISESK